ncbi:MAG TPA: DUF1501 domain-containing protein [Pyrinomonadaceae bacterium]|nr:DUF1501 domain-containing protein [Pyrinomonadaceae bacterium]
MSQTRREFLRRGACLLGAATLGSTLESLGLVSALAQAPASDYRALVCVFLNGGNDGNNMVVPLDAEYDAYNAIRGPSGLGFARTALHAINPASGRQFGFHPNMPEMQSLFQQQRLAVVCNVGTLVEPLTKASFQSGGRRPYQLFSHSDQIAQWMNSLASAPAQTGWGGRTADRTGALNGAATFPQVVSISGISLFTVGVDARPLAIADSRTSLNRVLPFNNPPGSAGYTAAQMNERNRAFNELRAFHDNVTLVRAAADTAEQAIQVNRALATADASLTTSFPDTTLGFQLEQVARLIKLRDTFSMKRQIFFCMLGGFDNHANQRAAGQHDALMQQVSQAMKAFYDSTVELGVQNNVTTFTLSDFGRTLQPAGSGATTVGSDHAWGNHHLVIGGAVRGGDFYGRFPTLALGGPDDADNRGRWIPTLSVEQYAATLANWYGLAPGDLPHAFPLIGRFPTANLGFMA